jgi:hypothetical protein
VPILRVQGKEAQVSESDSIRRAWEDGKCPCCTGDLIPWPGPDGVEHEPEAIAEGVMMCGRCMGNEHYIEAAEFILSSLIPKGK